MIAAKCVCVPAFGV